MKPSHVSCNVISFIKCLFGFAHYKNKNSFYEQFRGMDKQHEVT